MTTDTAKDATRRVYCPLCTASNTIPSGAGPTFRLECVRCRKITLGPPDERGRDRCPR